MPKTEKYSQDGEGGRVHYGLASSRSAARTLREQNTASEFVGTSDSVPAITEINDEARSEQQPVAHSRSEFAAMMQSALTKIQEAAAADAPGEAAFAEMGQAMTGLMDLSYKKVEPPKLPRDFATKWTSSDADPLHGGVMDDTVILASGYSVDQSYQHWFISQKNTCPVTGQSLPHSLTVPNQLLRDMIAAWCFDHSDLPASTTADMLSPPLIPPSEEQIQDILDKFSGHSRLQKEALHLIHRMSKTSKGVYPCLDKWPGLVPALLDLRKKWKSTWARDVEEERISSFLNLSMHRPNREILARQNKLPAVLIKVAEKAHDLSRDHKPDLAAEKERINNAGGFVVAGRVNGSLNLTRAIGDMELKTNERLPADRQIVSAEPEVNTVQLCDDDEFMVLACDGIWDCMSSQEVVDFVHGKLRTEDSLSSTGAWRLKLAGMDATTWQ